MAVNVNGGALEFDAVINVSQFAQQLGRIEKQLLGLTNTAQKEATAIENLVKRSTQAIATYASFASASNFIKDIIRVRGEFQQLEVAFRTMLGNKEAADKLLAQATDLAAKTPFTLADVGNASKQLLAYGFAADTIVDNIRRLGDIASGVGAPLNDIVYLYGTLRTQGRAYTKDIQQFTGRGIPIISELAKQFGVAEKEVMGLVEAGKVGFPEIERAFQNLTSSGGMFFNLMEEQSKTLTGLTSNLADAWSRMLNDIGKSNEGIFTGAIKGAIDLVENYETVLDVLKVLVITYGSYRAAIIATNTVQAIATAASKGYTIAETLRYQAMLLSERAMKLLNATMLSNPFVLVATALAALTAGLIIFGNEAKKVNAIESSIATVRENAAKSIVKEKVELEGLVKIAKDERQSKESRLNAISKLNKISPEYLGSLTLENIKTVQATDAINKYVKALETKAKAQAVENRLVELEKEQMDAENETRKLSTDLLRGRTKAQQDDMIKHNVIFKKYQNDLAKSTADRQQEKQRLLKEFKGDLDGTIGDRAGSDAAVKRTVAVIQEEISALEDRRKAMSATSKDYKEFTAQIKKLEQELESITGKAASKESAKAMKETANDLKQILEDIARAESEARQSGLVKEEAEIDRINRRYDELKSKVQALGIASNQKDGILQRIENARNLQLGNERQLREAEGYKKFIEQQKSVFEDFEEYKKQVGIQKAEELTQFQTAEYSDFIEFLKTQLAIVSQDKSLSGTVKKEFLVQALSAAEKEKLKADTAATIAAQKEVLEKTTSFNAKRKALEEKYYQDLNILRKNFNGQELEERTKMLQATFNNDLAELSSGAFQPIADAYEKTMSDIDGFDKEATKKRIERTKVFLALLYFAGQQNSELYKKIEKDQKALKLDKNAENIRSFQMFASIAGELGSTISQINGDLSVMGDILSAVSSQAGLLSKAFDKSATSEEKIGVGVQAVASIVSIIISSANQRKEAEEAYYNSVIAQQQEYNLLLNEQIGLQTEMSDSVFVKDYEGKIKDAYKKLADANVQYQLSLQNLLDGQAKLGQKNAVNWANVASGALSGAAAGAVIGSAVPVIGTIIGAVVGGVIGWLGGRKKKDVFGDLLQEYPELIQKGTNGVEELNVELAQTLISHDLVDKKTKLLLEDAIAWTEQIKEAREQMTGVISDLAGSLGGSLRDALVGAFKEGEDAAKAFKDTVSKSLEDMLSQIIFSNVFGKAFDTLQEDMLKSFDFGGDGNWIDDFGKFFADAQGLTEDFYKALDDAQAAAGGFNLDIFKRNAKSQNQANSTVGAIKGITEQQADLLAGQFGGIRLTALEQLKMAQNSFTALQNIELNTAVLHRMMAMYQDWNLNGLKVK